MCWGGGGRESFGEEEVLTFHFQINTLSKALNRKEEGFEDVLLTLTEIWM